MGCMEKISKNTHLDIWSEIYNACAKLVWLCQAVQYFSCWLIKMIWFVFESVVRSAFYLTWVILFGIGCLALLWPSLFLILRDWITTCCFWARIIIRYGVQSSKAHDPLENLSANFSNSTNRAERWTATGAAGIAWIARPGCSIMNKIGLQTEYCSVHFLPAYHRPSQEDLPFRSLINISWGGTEIPFTVHRFAMAQTQVNDMRNLNTDLPPQSRADLRQATKGLQILWKRVLNKFREFAIVLALGLHRGVIFNQRLFGRLRHIAIEGRGSCLRKRRSVFTTPERPFTSGLHSMNTGMS